VRDYFMWQMKSPEESKGEWDLFKLVRQIPAADIVPALSESVCSLVKNVSQRMFAFAGGAPQACRRKGPADDGVASPGAWTIERVRRIPGAEECRSQRPGEDDPRPDRSQWRRQDGRYSIC
jgi:hypothetical protein